MKGVSSTVIFVLFAIGIFIGAGVIIFWKWMELHGGITTKVSCTFKQRSYCNDLINGQNPNWNEIAPKTGCEKFGIVQPSAAECERLVR